MSLGILDGVAEEVSHLNHEERPNWPMSPTTCNSCDAGPYSSDSSYQRHWAMKHGETVTHFQCSLCCKMFGRRTDGFAHQRKQHKYPGQLTPETIRNMKYIDPNDVLPSKWTAWNGCDRSGDSQRWPQT
ncbi:hypothetical protein DPMN_052910 [Dreissena polymorpha]|uniref:C2H2-type domain-containing protein n=1 Tax=Dreissena polymorpha TaxID=45954 RepID=A0A9D4HQ69_DREPO|nr:hypothetical protein DPMN_052910 [Dreissena polymorpha]